MESRGVAWVFPGQGSQRVGMGREVHAASAAARQVFARADAVLERPISPLVLDGPEDELGRTENTQPALVVVSIALLAALRERHPDLPPPVVVAGHSLGELTALVAVESLTLEDGVRVARARGEAMQRAAPEGEGGMVAATGLDEEAMTSIRDRAAEAMPGRTLAIANYNAPAQYVIAGHLDVLEHACDLIEEAGGRALMLNVSAPFHCPLVAPAEAGLRAALSAVELRAPSSPVIANVDASPSADPEVIREKLARQVASPVRWGASIATMRSLGVTAALEIGPGNVLTRLAPKIDPEMHFVAVDGPAAFDAAHSLAFGLSATIGATGVSPVR